MKTLGVIHNTYYNRQPFKYAFDNFRKHFPDSPYVIYSDMGDDFSEYADAYTFYKRSDVRFYGTGPNARWMDKWDIWLSYYHRLKDACEICGTDYILAMEDDVLVTKRFDLLDDFALCGPCEPHALLTDHVIKFIEEKSKPVSNPYYGLCGGAIFNRRIFLDNYEKIISNLRKFHLEYTNNLTDRVAMYADANFVIQFHLLGYEYTCSQFIKDGTIIHPYPGYNKIEGY